MVFCGSGREEKLAHGQNNFCGGSDFVVVAHRTRAGASPRPRAVSFRRRCGARWGQLVSRGTMPPANPLPQLTIQSPLVDLELVCMALSLSAKRALDLFARRELLFAFDLGLGSRREIRVLACELARLQGQSVDRVADFPAAVQIIFPNAPKAALGVVGKMPLAVIARQLSISSDHALRLARDGSLSFVKGTQCRRGPHGSPAIEFSSVVELLKQRRIA